MEARVEICLIWAQDRNGAIGKDGRLPWHSPEDLQHFKDVTLSHPVVMGRKTWESLPTGALPGRQNIVVSRQLRTTNGAAVCSSLSDALTLAAVLHSGRVFIIGGAQLYAQTLAAADRLYVTHVQLDVEGANAFAPAIDLKQFERYSRKAVEGGRGPALVFDEYRRRRLRH